MRKIINDKEIPDSFSDYLSLMLSKPLISLIIPLLQENANFSMIYFAMGKVCTDKGSIKQLYHGLSACTGDNPLAKARGLSPRTGGQTMGDNPLAKARGLSPRTGGQTMV